MFPNSFISPASGAQGSLVSGLPVASLTFPFGPFPAFPALPQGSGRCLCPRLCAGPQPGHPWRLACPPAPSPMVEDHIWGCYFQPCNLSYVISQLI